MQGTNDILGIENLDDNRVVAGALSDLSTGGSSIGMTEENTRAILQACM